MTQSHDSMPREAGSAVLGSFIHMNVVNCGEVGAPVEIRFHTLRERGIVGHHHQSEDESEL